MSKSLPRHALTVALIAASGLVWTSAWAGTPLRVELPANSAAASGRLLISLQPAAAAEKAAKDGKVMHIEVSPFGYSGGALIGMDVPGIDAGKAFLVDTETMAYPSGLSALLAGDYYVQAVLDTARDNNYGGSSDDISSTPQKITLGKGGDLPLLMLDQREPPAGDYWDLPAGMPEAMRAQMSAAKPHVKPLDIVSPKLSAFWGRPIHMRGWVVLPPGYDKGNDHYPVAYSTHGFGGTLRSQLYSAASASASMEKGDTPPMIWVFLDESSATGTHEFADSVNNGPWGAALTEELIPQVDRDYRTDGKAASRFVTGHSSGGWASLWLQVRYPKVFGGGWPTSPDPGDFHDFTGADLYAPNANVYHHADGTPIPLVRDHAKVIASFEQFAKLEEVTGPVGGQMASFEWVFSPRGTDGRPMPMFDRRSGAVDPHVVAYWRDHYDVAHRITTQWNTLKPDLDGKVHLIVGTADTFYLDGAARKLQAAMKSVGAKTDFRFVPDRTHGDLYTIGDNKRALGRVIAWEMYRVARPDAKLPTDLPKVPVEAAAK
ncbi:alpha/beta hydrolase-fold protein [Solilutibacter silvestris]|uniref:Putative esterase n=1 Tax=Solilutibacter silvestris TaxID=1645665 RepID=A0A2K1Q2R1_9GAMM|nr:alpha/beta hydrolase-fold protein [Lysobacter silvestris]PNS09335.1 putative esterase [Lysobacter silvestris]